MQLPSKQFFLIGGATLGSVVIVIGAYFLASRYGQAPPPVESPQLTVTKNLLTSINEQDTDKDGLKDWQEALWGTDPKNPDSDGDKTTDGDEIKTDRNPLKKGPDDKLDIEAIKKGQGLSGEAVATTTQTDALARELLIRYLSLRQGGQLADGQDAEIANDALASSLEPLSIKTYTASDLKIGTDDSATALHAYGNAVAKIIKANTVKDTNEALIVREAIETQDPRVIKRLDTIIASDEVIRNKILSLTVPSSLTQAHLNLINNLSELVATLKGMSTVLEDPLLAMVAINNYNNRIEVFFTMLNELKITLKAKNITFTPTEDGYLFNQGV